MLHKKSIKLGSKNLPLPVSTKSRLEWNFIEFTDPVWPRYCNKQRPDPISQIQAEWSADAVPIIGWVDLQETCQTPSLW